MKKMIIFTLVLADFIQPVYSSEIIQLLESSHNPAQIAEQMVFPNGVFSVETARKFIFQLKNEAKLKYNIDLNLNNVIEEALGIMEQSGNFSEAEIVTVREFYTQLFSQSLIITRECHSKFFKKKKNTKKSENLNNALCKVDQEVMLPDHMAWGYILLLGGALLCLIPTGITQGIGVGLISGGVTMVGQAAIEGERPYYVDPATGQKIMPINPSQESSINSGIQF